MSIPVLLAMSGKKNGLVEKEGNERIGRLKGIIDGTFRVLVGFLR
jgi:hypothetical protein